MLTWFGETGRVGYSIHVAFRSCGECDEKPTGNLYTAAQVTCVHTLVVREMLEVLQQRRGGIMEM